MSLRVTLCLALLAAAALAACPFHAAHSGPAASAECHPSVRAEARDPILGVPLDTTVKGCACSSPCGATPDIGASKCDWCKTKDNCGSRNLFFSWDFCAYSPNATYESKPAAVKSNFLWSLIKQDQSIGEYPNLALAFTESSVTSFANPKDWMPQGRSKVIHSVGAVCKFSMQVNPASPYTGVFAPNANVKGFVRLGSAVAVDEKSGVVPGVGVKFMRSGVQSGNFVALNTLDALPGNSYNFFLLNLSNHLPPTDSVSRQILLKKFQQASGCATQVGLSDICSYDVDGNAVSDPVFPYKVKLVSTLATDESGTTQQGLSDRLVDVLTAGTTVYQLLAYDSPAASKAEQSLLLGEMIADEQCVNSLFGDSQLFFKHQLIEEDWQLKPEWIDEQDPHQDCMLGENDKINPSPPAKCGN